MVWGAVDPTRTRVEYAAAFVGRKVYSWITVPGAGTPAEDRDRILPQGPPQWAFHLRDTMAHEMVHLWLWARRRPYGHTPEFMQKLKEMGASRFNPVPQTLPHKHVYECPGCQQRVLTRRRLRRGVACRRCCELHNRGRWDGRFVLKKHVPSCG